MCAGGSLVKLAGEDVGEDGVVAATLGILQVLDCLLVVTGEDVDDTLVGLGDVGAGLLEAVGCGGVVTFPHGQYAKGVLEVAVLSPDGVEGLLCLCEVVGSEIGGAKVEPCSVAVELADGLVVELDLAVGVLDEGGSVQEGGLVENVDVVVNQLEEFLGGVVLVLDVGDEPCATQLRKDVALEFGVDGGHILDLALTHCRVAVHGEDAEDEVLVFDIGILDELLEAFPVLTDALHLGICDVLALHDLVPSLVGALRTLVGELGVEALSAFRGSVCYDLGPGEGLPLVGLDLVESLLEVLDGLALELGGTDIGGVDLVHDLAFSRLLDDGLVAVSLERHLATGLDEHVGGVQSVGDLLGGELVGLVLVLGDTAEFEVALLHSLDIVEMEFP